MASVISQRLVEATFRYPINANSNPTPAKTPSQRSDYTTQVVRSPPIVQRPHYLAASQEDVVQDSLEIHVPKPAHQSKILPNSFEINTTVDNDQVVQDSYEANPLASSPQSQSQPTQQRSIEAQLPNQGPPENNFVAHSIEAHPSVHQPPKSSIQDDSVQQTPSGHPSFQENVVLEESRPVQRVEDTVSENDDDDNDNDDNISDCITVCTRVETPPDPRFAVRDTLNLFTGGRTVSLQEEGIHSTNSLKQTVASQPAATATTAFTTPSMASKTSTSKGTFKSTTSANQSRKAASTSSKSKTSQRTSQTPTSEIVNRGETSAATLLQKMRAGVTSQVDVRRQVLEAAPPIVPTKPSPKASTRPSQASTKKPSTKLSQQSQAKSQKLPKTQPLHNTGPSDDDVDEYALPQSAEKRRTKPAQKTKPAAPFIPAANKGKSQSKKQTAKAPKADEDENDEEHDSPKTNKSRAVPPKRETRASTRAQTEKVTKTNRLNDFTRDRTTEAAKKVEKPVQQQPPTSRASKAPRAEELEDFEDSVTHVGSDKVAEVLPAAQERSAIRPIEKRKPRQMTDKESKLMHAISSPGRLDNATTLVTTITEKQVPAAEHQFSTTAYKPIGEQGTTQRHPITVGDDDDGDDDDNDDAVNAVYDDNYDELINQEMSQEEPRKQKRSPPEEPFLLSPSKEARGSSNQDLPAKAQHVHSDYLVEERDSRKPNMVGFNDAGPKNQGIARKNRTGMNRILPFEGDSASPAVLVEHSLHDLPQIYAAIPSGDTPLEKPLETVPTSEIPVHVTTVGQSASLELGDPALSKPKPKPPKPVVSIDVSTQISMGPLATPRKAAAAGSKRKLVEEVDDLMEETRVRDAKPRIQSEVAERMIQIPSRQPADQHDTPPHRDPAKDVATKPSVPSPKEEQSTESCSSDSRIGLSSKRLEISEPQTSAAYIDPDHTLRPVQRQPKQDRRSLNYAEPTSVTNTYMNRPEIDPGPKLVASNRSMPLPVEKEQRSRPHVNPAEKPALDRKRSPVKMTKEPTKRQRISTQEPRQPTALPVAAANPLTRKLSQVADNGSPIPFGGEVAQETDFVRHTRHERLSLLPAIVFTQQSAADPFAQIMASKQKKSVRQESPLEQVSNMQQGWPVQLSQTVTHAGFDGDTQLATDFAQAPKLEKEQSPKPQRNPPRRVDVAHKSLGLMDALRSEAIPQAGVQDEADKEDSKEASQVDEPMEEDDPDKTLVNEISDDGGGDDSESGNSSDSDDDDQGEDGLSIWRKALESHQGDVYDQMIRIAHRLTVHLKDHEIAIEDISKDYSQDGARLIERFEKDNEERLEQYCFRASKMKGALVLGFKQVSGILQKDVKDMTMSSDKHGKMLQKQVDAGERLEQIMQAYHP